MTDDFLKRLEAERFDISYRTISEQRRERLTPGEQRVLQEDLISRAQRSRSETVLTAETIWNAGRFAAGARDEKAITANDALRAAKGLKK